MPCKDHDFVVSGVHNHPETIPSLPSLQALRILEAATRLRSYSAAAKELGMTHGAVSRQMQSLERWAGSPLFERHGASMDPTEHALALTARTREGLRILGDAFAMARSKAVAANGGLVVSTPHAIAGLWLMPRLARLHMEIPRLVQSVETEPDFAEELGRKADVALRFGGGGWRDAQYEQLRADEVIAVGPPAQVAQIRSADDLLSLPLIETPVHAWRAWMNAAGITDTAGYRPALVVSDVLLAIQASLDGIGLSLAPAVVVDELLWSGRLAKVQSAAITDNGNYYAVWHNGARQKRKIDLLRAWLRTELMTERRIAATEDARHANHLVADELSVRA